MVITRNGRPEMDRREMRFECARCGCEFTAAPWEYARVFDNRKLTMRIKCPWCGDYIVKTVERDEVTG